MHTWQCITLRTSRLCAPHSVVRTMSREQAKQGHTRGYGGLLCKQLSYRRKERRTYVVRGNRQKEDLSTQQPANMIACSSVTTSSLSSFAVLTCKSGLVARSFGLLRAAAPRTMHLVSTKGIGEGLGPLLVAPAKCCFAFLHESKQPHHRWIR